ncbi:hypothetical protein Cpir12675_006436 [Ceratocystis pirilliformis]|uniref:Uncharacterized protein n=1 Tax=Ceratocystis pirilliformis TaxID=259994 RepID=A0ABR3YIQ5_9PEZI
MLPEGIFEEIYNHLGLDRSLKPCQVFDLIGGTKTGGYGFEHFHLFTYMFRKTHSQNYSRIIAVMLGRLGMDLAHKSLVSESDNHPNPPASNISGPELEAAISAMIGKSRSDSQPKLQLKSGAPEPNKGTHKDILFKDKHCTKTAVLVMTKCNVETRPALLATYKMSRGFDQCTVLVVAKVLSTSDSLAGSIEIGRDDESFVDAKFGYNNPCEILISEAKKEFQGRDIIILSIGTDVNNVVPIDCSESVTDTTMKVVTSAKAADQRLQGDYRDTRAYHRFNVEDGLKNPEDKACGEVSKISALSRNYVNEK